MFCVICYICTSRANCTDNLVPDDAQLRHSKPWGIAAAGASRAWTTCASNAIGTIYGISGFIIEQVPEFFYRLATNLFFRLIFL